MKIYCRTGEVVKLKEPLDIDGFGFYCGCNYCESELECYIQALQREHPELQDEIARLKNILPYEL